MNRISVLLALVLAVPGAVVRADHPSSLDHLLRQVELAHEQDARVRQEREQRFMQAREEQQNLLEDMRARVEEQRERGEQLRLQHAENEKILAQLQSDLQARSGNLGELFGTVRHTAGDLQALLHESLVSAQYPGRAQWMEKLAASKTLPGITELERFWLLLQQEINQSGLNRRFMAEVTGTDGISKQREVIRIGVFDAISQGQYLRYLPELNRFALLSRQPDARALSTARAYTDTGNGYASMVIDPTRGGLLNMLTRTPTLIERIQQGGVVGYIILGIGLLGIVLVAVRLFSLARTGRRMQRQLREPEASSEDNPLGRVLRAAGDSGSDDIDALELTLDEAILRETPTLQRGLGLLKLLAAVAPLLGLLGTVTGMILTFQSITLFGTGDPKLMAGGISQALVTTVLGLVVAIPLLFSHTLLASRSRTLIQILDEQSAGLVAQQVNRRD